MYKIRLYNPNGTFINEHGFSDPFKATRQFNNLAEYYKRLGKYTVELLKGNKLLRSNSKCDIL